MVSSFGASSLLGSWLEGEGLSIRALVEVRFGGLGLLGFRGEGLGV